MAEGNEEGHQDDSGEKHKNPFQDLKDKFQKTQLHETLHNAKVSLIHKKQQVGKFANLVNPQHRHDEEHEKACDDKRTNICESHRFKSYFPERDNNMVKWYVDGRNYFWVCLGRPFRESSRG